VKVQVKVHPIFTAALATGSSQVHSPDNSPWAKGSWNPLDESQNWSGHTTGEEKKPLYHVFLWKLRRRMGRRDMASYVNLGSRRR